MAFGIRPPAFPVVIREDGGRGRVIVLAGTDLPADDGAFWIGGRLRGKTTHYPGSSVPTSQILGPEEDEISFAGVLDDRRARVPGHALALAALIDAIRRAGRPAMFEWGPFLRRVRWVEATFRPLDVTRVAYRIELAVIDHAQGLKLRVIPGIRSIPVVGPILDGAQQLAGVIGELPHSLLGEGVTRAVGAASGLVSGLEGVQRGLSALGSTIGLIDTGAASGVLAGVDGCYGQGRSLLDALATLDYRAAAASPIDALVGAGSAIAGAISDGARLMDGLSSLRLRVADIAGASSAAALYVASSGETLRRIAARFLGDSERWHEIASANGKLDPTVSGGEVLRIPGGVERRREEGTP